MPEVYAALGLFQYLRLGIGRYPNAGHPITKDSAHIQEALVAQRLKSSDRVAFMYPICPMADFYC